MSRVSLKAIISYLEIAHRLIFKWEMSRTSLMAIVFLFGSRPKSKFKKEMSSFSRMALISHTFSFVIHRGRCDRNGDSQRGKQRLQRYNFFSDISFYLHKEFPSRQTKGGDVIENVDFPKRKQRLQGYKILQRSHSIYTKITTSTNCEDLSLTRCQSFLLKTLTTCEDFLEET